MLALHFMGGVCMLFIWVILNGCLPLCGSTATDWISSTPNPNWISGRKWINGLGDLDSTKVKSQKCRLLVLVN